MDRFLDRLPWRAVSVFGAWTVLAEACTAVGANLWTLEALSLAAIVIALARRIRAHRRSPDAQRGADSSGVTELHAPVESTQGSGFDRLAALLAAGAVVLAWRVTSSEWVLSIGGGALALAGLARRRGAPEPESGAGPRDVRALPPGWIRILLALSTSALVLVAHNPDADDAYYLNVAARAASDPSAALLHGDGIFGIEGMPLQLPVYEAHSIELLVGAVAHATGLEPVHVAHLGLSGLAGLLLPLAMIELLRRLRAPHPTATALMTIVVLVFLAAGTQALGTFALLRLHQGKGILVGVLVPLVIAAALAFAERPSRANALRLLATQVASVGASSTALMVTPWVASLTLLAAFGARGIRRAPRPLLGGLAAANAHAMVVLAWLGPAMVERTRQLDAAVAAVTTSPAVEHLARRTLEATLGDGAWAALVLACALAAWSFSGSARGGRALAALAAFGFTAALSPIADGRFAEDVAAIHFRTTWVFPWAVAVALVLVGCASTLAAAASAVLQGSIGAPGARGDRWHGVLRGATLVLAAGLPWSLGAPTVFDAALGTRLALPSPKAPPQAYAAARALATHLPPNATVLVADDVAPWVSIFRSTPHPLYSRYIYERYLRADLDAREVEERRTLAGFVSRRGTQLSRSELLCYHADVRDLRGIVMRDAGPRTERFVQSLRACGFELILRNDHYLVWTRIDQRNSGRSR